MLSRALILDIPLVYPMITTVTSSRGPSSGMWGGSVLDLDDPETLERRAHVADLGVDIEGHPEIMENDHYRIEIDHGGEGSEGSRLELTSVAC